MKNRLRALFLERQRQYELECYRATFKAVFAPVLKELEEWEKLRDEEKSKKSIMQKITEDIKRRGKND